MNRKNILSGVVGIILVWSFYGYLIREISYLEKNNLKLERELKELEKEKSKRIYEYDLLMDLRKIEKEMNKNKNMIISEKINFFKIDENSF
ncbi:MULTISPECIES: hypothetical protein [unclassified Cetobacterium]|uniref:hypothetical protein n=1 Tax=unclassified Cetobacterium TaxID=2630983 RepID=UPI00163C0432|nr:hypothetical protein [Cetobacterium sp. 8H]MBC2850509.1 hypothetical protein [Cetobacterium sp. 8H]